MSAELTALPFTESLQARLAQPAAKGLSLYWLGQAGFVIDAGGYRLVIDPYLSDSLAEKYRGRLYPHQRMMSAPVTTDGLGDVDLVLSTHQHTDHMDPQTLQPLLGSRPAVKLVAPRAAEEEALKRSGIGRDRLLLLDAGDRIEPLPGVSVTATRSAHETLERDAAGHYKFLGYVIEIGGVRLWHSGDTIPYDGMVAEVAALQPDIALLPVNGRSAELLANGVPGNLALAEAIDIAKAIGAKALVAHHFGMFDFNTVDPAEIDRAASQVAGPRLLRAALQTVYRWG
ncbi:MBL fold metallo-hydrolase [Dongia rigui]|uniref:MBL fold metallo-hydrolase n=1 Tax=Dongia rigui TaxID=940149 RepID=A0ABU5E254_9PROT|nr:MBL fold metallo-hydrolase [Dongia rigui]MDY0873568.1 MBL fold metallo-hydrolase [Dongia rigui]